MEKWYKFWKKSGPNQFLIEDYIEINEDWSKEAVKGICEQWAETVGGFNTHYFYGCVEIKNPPKDWLEKHINQCKADIKETEILIKHYEQIIKTFYNNRIKLTKHQ